MRTFRQQFFLICTEKNSLVFLNLHSYSHYSISAMLLAILYKNIPWYENRKKEKRKGRKTDRKGKKINDCYSHFLQNIYDHCTTAHSKLSSWLTFLVSNLPSAPSRSKCEKLRVTIFPSGTRTTYKQFRDTG